MSYISIYLHCVWVTKNRFPFLNSFDLRLNVWKHIKENADKNKIFIDSINGHQDHCHCLISLNSDQTIGEVIKLLKGESSFWINNTKLLPSKFSWQREFYVTSVSPSKMEIVRSYIRNQEKHHLTKSLDDELKQLESFIKS